MYFLNNFDFVKYRYLFILRLRLVYSKINRKETFEKIPNQIKQINKQVVKSKINVVSYRAASRGKTLIVEIRIGSVDDNSRCLITNNLMYRFYILKRRFRMIAYQVTIR